MLSQGADARRSPHYHERMLARLPRLLVASSLALSLVPAGGAAQDGVQPRATESAPAGPGAKSATPPQAGSERPAAEPAQGSGRSGLPRKVVPPAAVLEEVAGTVRAVDRKTHRIEVATAGGPVELTLDRNTLVYTARGLGTVLDVAPGSELRAGRNASFVAYWVQVGTPGPAPTPAPGTGPGGGSGAPPSESVAPAGAAPGATGATGGSAGPPTSSPPGGSGPPSGGQ